MAGLRTRRTITARSSAPTDGTMTLVDSVDTAPAPVKSRARAARAASLKLVENAATALLRAAWFTLIPALLAALVVRYLAPDAPDPFDPVSGRGEFVLGVELWVPLWAVLFLLLSL